mgnify:CR=1 FL=1
MASEHFESSFNLCKELRKELDKNSPLAIANRRDLNEILIRLGNLRLKEGKINEAEYFVKYSLKLNRELLEDKPTPQHKRHVASSLLLLGKLYQHGEKPNKALECLYESKKLLTELKENTKNKLCRRELAFTDLAIGEILQGKKSEALDFYQEAFKLGEELRKEEGDTLQNCIIAFGGAFCVASTCGEQEKSKYYKYCLGLIKKSSDLQNKYPGVKEHLEKFVESS